MGGWYKYSCIRFLLLVTNLVAGTFVCLSVCGVVDWLFPLIGIRSGWGLVGGGGLIDVVRQVVMRITDYLGCSPLFTLLLHSYFNRFFFACFFFYELLYSTILVSKLSCSYSFSFTVVETPHGNISRGTKKLGLLRLLAWGGWFFIFSRPASKDVSLKNSEGGGYRYVSTLF